MATSKGPLPFVLKFKGNKTFSAFTGASIAEEETLFALHSVITKCSKVLEEGSRLENLAWRLWYLHSAVVSSKKDREEFKKVSRGVADSLHKDKGKTLVELPLPELNISNSDRLANRVAEKSRTRRASREGGEKPTSMNSMMGSFVLDKTVGQTVGVSKRRDSLPTGGKKPTNLKNKSRPNSPGPSGLTRSSSSRSTMEDGRRRGRASSRTELLMTPATTQQPHPPPSQSAPTFISLPTSSSSFAYTNQPPSSSFQPPPAPPSSSQSFQSTPAYPTSSSFHPQNASFNFTQPPTPNSSANHISLSIDDIFELAHPSHPPPPHPASNPLSNPNSSVSASRTDSNEVLLEDILKGLNEGGNASALDFADLGLDGWPTDFGGSGNSNLLDSSGTGEVPEVGFSFEDLFVNSGMTGIEPSSLDSNATLRPHLPVGGSSFTTYAATASSVFSSSASPEEIKQQMLGVLAGSPFPLNDRVRRLSKAGFLGRDEAGMGVGTGPGSGSGTGGEDSTGMGGFGGDGGLPPKLTQPEAQRRRSSTSRKSSGTSSLGSSSPKKGKGRVSLTNLSQPQEFVHPSSVSSFDHPSKRRRGSDLSSDYGASPAFVSSPWTPSALSPAAIQLPPSNIHSPWSSNVHTPSLELTTGFEGMGVGGGFLSTPHQTQSPGVVDGGNQWSTLGAGEGAGGNASEFSFAIPLLSSSSASSKPKSQQPSPSIRPYHPSSSASAPLLRPKQRTSSHSSISSQSASGSSTPGTLTPYQAGFLSSFAPIQPSSSSTGPVRRSSETQSARHSSGVQAPLISTPSSPNKRNAGLPGLSSSSTNFGGGFGGGDGGGGPTARPRLTLQEQLELAGMVPKSSKPSLPSRQKQSTDPPQQSFDFAMGSSPEFGGDASRGGGGGGANGGERGGVNFGSGGSGSQLGAVPEG